MSDTQLFDEMVDYIQRGEVLISDFETDDPGGFTVTVDYKSLTIADDEIDIILSGEILDTIQLFLEARRTARETPMSIDWDQLLLQNPDQNSL